MEVIQDPLWKQAKERVGFRRNLMSYLVMNAFFWAIWFFTGQGYPWPIWPMLGWGLGLVFHYIKAYHPPKEDAIQREYDKLKGR